MRIIKNFLSCVFIIVLLLGGCKCKDDEVPTRLLSQESKDYCLFLPGSWWVYQNDQNLEYDTLRITEIQNEIFYSKNSNDNTERNTISFVQKQLYSLNTLRLIRGDRESALYFTYNGGFGEMLYFDSPSYRQDSIADTNDAQLLIFYDSIQFNSTKYRSVKYFKSLVFIEYRNVYWAKHIGIVKLEKPNGNIWNLINYSVQQ